MKPTILLLVFLSTLFVDLFSARAQSYAISSFTIGGGGGTSSGDNYALSGTIGQPDAGALEGGSYKLVGGFWNDLITVSITGEAMLTIRRSGGTVILSWRTSATEFVLEATDTLSTSPIAWTAVSEAALPAGENQTVTVTASGQARFYRLRHP